LSSLIKETASTKNCGPQLNTSNSNSATLLLYNTYSYNYCIILLRSFPTSNYISLIVFSHLHLVLYRYIPIFLNSKTLVQLIILLATPSLSHLLLKNCSLSHFLSERFNNITSSSYLHTRSFSFLNFSPHPSQFPNTSLKPC
jgi:hypothetical protein